MTPTDLNPPRIERRGLPWGLALLLCLLPAGCGQFEVETGKVERSLTNTRTETVQAPAPGQDVEVSVDGEKLGTFLTDARGEVSVELEPFLARAARGNGMEIVFKYREPGGGQETKKFVIIPQQARDLLKEITGRVGPCRLLPRLEATAFFVKHGGFIGRTKADVLRVEIYNRGPGEAYAVVGHVESTLEGLNGAELIFGTIPPGRRKTWDVDVRWSESWPKGYSPFKLRFKTHKNAPPEDLESSLVVE